MIPIPPQLAAWAATAAARQVLFWVKVGALVALVAVVALMGWRVTVWREGYHALQATEKALQEVTADRDRYAAAEASAWQALREAEGKAKEREAADRATAERIERDLQTKLAAADARGRDLARRLLNATRAACPGAGAMSGPAGAAAGAPGPATEPGDGEAIERATADHLSACEADAERLAGWQEWWAGVRR